MKREEPRFATEADLVASFCSQLARYEAKGWTAYHETAGFDLLLAGPDGIQVGIEAKLSLNCKVLEQALPSYDAQVAGPDYRAVLVPRYACQLHMERIAAHCGLTLIRHRPGWHEGLPDERWAHSMADWHNWCPTRRCALPEYVPDVSGGHAAPVQLSPWKIQAIKLLILLERRGYVTRADMKALKLSPTRWTAAYYGFLARGAEGYVRWERTPDLKAQHPRNWAEIEADFDVWSKAHELPQKLIGAAA